MDIILLIHKLNEDHREPHRAQFHKQDGNTEPSGGLLSLVDGSEESTSIQGRRCARDILVASLVALSLQWGTIGAAIAVALLTPTIGEDSLHNRSCYDTISDSLQVLDVAQPRIAIRRVVHCYLDHAYALQFPIPLLHSCTA